MRRPNSYTNDVASIYLGRVCHWPLDQFQPDADKVSSPVHLGPAPLCRLIFCEHDYTLLLPSRVVMQHRRSAATGTLLVPRARTATGQRSFAVNGPAIWNRLPPWHYGHRTFKRALKKHLFSTARRHWDVFMILAPDINIHTYLLTYFLTSVRFSTDWDVVDYIVWKH